MNIIPKQQKPERILDEGPLIELGQWYWYFDPENKSTELGCVTHIGSNYFKLSFPTQNEYHTIRIHMNDFNSLKIELNPNQVIQDNVQHYKNEVDNILNKIKQITARLGVSTRVGITDRHTATKASNNSLVCISQNDDPNQYKNDLIKTKEKDLPELFKEMEHNNKWLSAWLSAEAIPLKAVSDSVKGCLEEVDDRIFAVSLYAGLAEEVVQFADGKPADYGDKLHIMQRRCYMDEECLLDYRSGGMDFESLNEFNKWMAKPNNRDRILPFPRCLAAFKIRRNAKYYDYDGSLSKFIKINDANAKNTQTYLYIRNGDKLYFLRSDLNFNERIFPDPNVCDPSVPLMAKCNIKELEFMTVNEYEELSKIYAKEKAQYEKEEKERLKWFEENVGPRPEEEDFTLNEDGTVTYNQGKFTRIITKEDVNDNRWSHDCCDAAYYWYHNNIWRRKLDGAPYGGYHHKTKSKVYHKGFNPNKWFSFDQNTVYYDDGLKQIADKIKYYNRIALIVQGLFDRSEILHPHPPVQTWTAKGFEAAVTLIYDESKTLYNGEKPDFEAYRIKCNEYLGPHAVTIGQQKVYEEKMAEKENERQENDYRIRNPSNYNRYKPFGDPGPGLVAQIAKWMPKAHKAKFTWASRKQHWNLHSQSEYKYTTVTVEEKDLFCVDGYEKGDFIQFFKDPRTRAEYLKWAPILLAAEDYLAGKIKASIPISRDDVKSLQ
ncbi:MAG: hypothetical protein GF364_18990 [Candidatus Lokiarchaeota archaeon]|nr:hypothetical protein [Candidatus Lokiarchaeota archaeon]